MISTEYSSSNQAIICSMAALIPCAIGAGLLIAAINVIAAAILLGLGGILFLLASRRACLNQRNVKLQLKQKCLDSTQITNSNHKSSISQPLLISPLNPNTLSLVLSNSPAQSPSSTSDAISTGRSNDHPSSFAISPLSNSAPINQGDTCIFISPKMANTDLPTDILSPVGDTTNSNPLSPSLNCFDPEILELIHERHNSDLLELIKAPVYPDQYKKNINLIR